jgi:hypothetical protein
VDFWQFQDNSGTLHVHQFLPWYTPEWAFRLQKIVCTYDSLHEFLFLNVNLEKNGQNRWDLWQMRTHLPDTSGRFINCDFCPPPWADAIWTKVIKLIKLVLRPFNTGSRDRIREKRKMANIKVTIWLNPCLHLSHRNSQKERNYVLYQVH